MTSEKPLEASDPLLLLEPLTEREQTILHFVAEGFSDREIALRLSIALDTVKWYNKRIFGKLDVHNRTQAATRAKILGLLDNPLRADSATTSVAKPLLPRNNLPAQVSSFIGRHHERQAIKILLEKSRLLTLIGIGGSGKTRLALQVATEMLSAFSDGVYLIPLAPVPAPDQILRAIAEHLNFQFELHDEPLAQLLHYFSNKKLLLLLDNFDHLIAGAGCIIDILQAAPEVKVLVTSRERLNLYGEATYLVSGMALPNAQQPFTALESESIQLFIERTQLVSPHLDWNPDMIHHIAHICRLVAGMPLGIELAATWMDTLSPQEIANEIELNLDILEVQRQDMPESQRSIRAAFDRSWHLLDEAQQTAFRRLAVFRGGFTREASEAIADVGLRTLQALVNKSLLRRNPHTARYEFHELLRYYAEEQLEASSEAHLTYQAHAAYFANFMAERWPQLKDHRQKLAIHEVEADIENVRAAWQYWIKAGNVTQLNKFLHTVWAVYDIRGWYLAGIELFEQGIQVMRTVDTEEAQAGLGWLMAVQGLYYGSGETYNRASTPAPAWMVEYGLYFVRMDVRHGFPLAWEGVEILKRLEHYREMLIIPLMSLFITSCLLDEEGIPLQTAQDSLEVATRIGDEWAIAKAKQLLALKAIGDGDYEQAQHLAHECLATFDANGDNWSKSILCTEVLGLLAIRLRQFELAKDWIHKGLRAAGEIGYKYAIQMAYWQLGFLATLEENYAEAGLYWSRALKVDERILGGRTFIGFGGSKGAE